MTQTTFFDPGALLEAVAPDALPAFGIYCLGCGWLGLTESGFTLDRTEALTFTSPKAAHASREYKNARKMGLDILIKEHLKAKKS
jgi:hypothetical protein